MPQNDPIEMVIVVNAAVPFHQLTNINLLLLTMNNVLSTRSNNQNHFSFYRQMTLCFSLLFLVGDYLVIGRVLNSWANRKEKKWPSENEFFSYSSRCRQENNDHLLRPDIFNNQRTQTLGFVSLGPTKWWKSIFFFVYRKNSMISRCNHVNCV